ncbi:hypothetical protein SAMN05444280_1352 [Tangfeifania diversioriginum]|uniref:B box-type domain-containing protein n=1 Tax=Tangfeifania diversioriginum TaxID=1168035 RepID=A0A1M6MQ83_9BACT|nr:hypothetical protein SAMN05444280_1352 [Tangfeifania diversioriginum]
MNCINHPSESAVSQCQVCGKGLCVDCTNKFSKPICPDCFSVSRQKQKRAAVTEVILTLLIGLPVGIILDLLVNDTYKTPDSFWESHFFLIYMGLGIVAGWKTLTRITPQIFLFLPVLGWLLYFVIMAVFSLFAGLIAFPIRTIRNLSLFFK